MMAGRASKHGAPPAIPLAVALGCLASAASAQSLADFAGERCLQPILSGNAFAVAGLVERTADELDLTPEAISAAEPEYFLEEETGLFFATIEAFGIRSCLVGHREGPARVDLADFEAVVDVNDMVIHEACRGLFEPASADEGPLRTTLATAMRPNPGGRFAVAGHTVDLETGSTSILVFERAEPVTGASCGGDA